MSPENLGPGGLSPERSEPLMPREQLENFLVNEKAGSARVNACTLHAHLRKAEVSVNYQNSIELNGRLGRERAGLRQAEVAREVANLLISLEERGTDPDEFATALDEVRPIYNAYVDAEKERLEQRERQSRDLTMQISESGGSPYRTFLETATATDIFLRDLKDINLEKKRQQSQ